MRNSDEITIEKMHSALTGNFILKLELVHELGSCIVKDVRYSVLSEEDKLSIINLIIIVGTNFFAIYGANFCGNGALTVI